MAGLRTDKEMGNFWAWFWLIAFWGTTKVLGLMGETGSKQESSQHPQGWNPVNKNLFPSTQTIGSRGFKEPSGQTPVCTVTCTQMFIVV